VKNLTKLIHTITYTCTLSSACAYTHEHIIDI